MRNAQARPATDRSPAKRDLRIDVLRGAALFMIFADHIPSNFLGDLTLHNFALCDAAELFVLLAGMSAFSAYGRVIDRDGWKTGIARIARRCRQIYIAQLALSLATFGYAWLWAAYFNLTPTILARVFSKPAHALLLNFLMIVQPDYLNILPLYLVLLAMFPIVWALLRVSTLLALAVSGGVWLAAGFFPWLNLPNWATSSGWYFDPFAWQFIFVIGVAMASLSARYGGNLPWNPVMAVVASAFLLLTFPQASAWHGLGLPSVDLFPLDAADKTHLGWPRIVSALALTYFVFAPRLSLAVASMRLLHPLQRCGRHSLEVFVTGCLFALFARLLFRVTDHGFALQALANIVGMLAMIVAARVAERGSGKRRRNSSRPTPAALAARAVRRAQPFADTGQRPTHAKDAPSGPRLSA